MQTVKGNFDPGLLLFLQFLFLFFIFLDVVVFYLVVSQLKFIMYLALKT